MAKLITRLTYTKGKNKKMKHLILSIFDSKANAYLPPWYAPTEATACRIFENSVIDPNTLFAKFPGDFTLFGIGVFDDETAEIETYKVHINHGTALQHQAAFNARVKQAQIETNPVSDNLRKLREEDEARITARLSSKGKN